MSNSGQHAMKIFEVLWRLSRSTRSPKYSSGAHEHGGGWGRGVGNKNGWGVIGRKGEERKDYGKER